MWKQTLLIGMKYVHSTLVFPYFSQLLIIIKRSIVHFLCFRFYLKNSKKFLQNLSTYLEVIKSLKEEIPVVNLKFSVTGSTISWPRVWGFWILDAGKEHMLKKTFFTPSCVLAILSKDRATFFWKYEKFFKMSFEVDSHCSF